MTTMVLDCPHCGAKKVSFKMISEAARPNHPADAVVSALCNACNMPICALLRSARNILFGATGPLSFDGDLLDARSPFNSIGIYPSRALLDTPHAIPDAVRRAYEQAAGSRSAGHFDAACSMYRKAMELGLKAFSPDIEAWKIEKRIDKMAAEHRITTELQTWAHELRLDGNEALHGDGEASEEMTSQMHELCRFLLIYLYTLPAQVAAATARREV